MIKLITNLYNNPEPKKSIALQTAKGRDIPNEQGEDLLPRELEEAEKIAKKYSLSVLRSGANALYNCHGLTFANRRTCIFEPLDVAKLLEEEYKEVNYLEVKAGDIVIYWQENSAEHSGIVVEANGNQNEFRVVSKWGRGKEFLHPLYYCPYENSVIKFYRFNL